MSINVIRGPAAISYRGRNGHTYWIGYTSGNQSTGIPRRSSDKALEDARKLERKELAGLIRLYPAEVENDRVTSDNQ